jgi:arginine/lysine/ornithine decarboxylase
MKLNLFSREKNTSLPVGYFTRFYQQYPLSDRPSQHKIPILETLSACTQRPHAAFYTPGHKRGQGISHHLAQIMGNQVFQLDLPELPDLDNLFAPEGVIREAQELAAQAFGADQTWFLVNGSTCGIEAAILAVCQPGDKIILPRNVHRSAIAALVLAGAIPIFVQPDYDPHWDLAHSLTVTGVAQALRHHPDAKAIMIVYPTYYGVCGDVGAIAQLAHQHNIPLLVDEAHGPHFAFHPDLPCSALEAGADLVVQSTHKVLGAMTQASMLHLRSTRIDANRLTTALQLVQSSSPSYILLASLDAARQQMALQGKELLTQTLNLAKLARTQLSQIPELSVFELPLDAIATNPTLDPTRLTVRVTGLGITGFTADEILHDHLQTIAELPALKHLTFLISLGNTSEDINTLVSAFQNLASTINSDHLEKSLIPSFPLSPFPTCTWDLPPLSPREAYFATTEMVAIAQASDRISAECICPYPPGIPVLIPGELITSAAIDYLLRVLAAGGMITGCTDPTLKTLRVVK